jgi:hypothetical protein
MGIKPPKGVILYGQPGTGTLTDMFIVQLIRRTLYQGKTLLAKAVANQTSATFLRVVGSELIQKYLVCRERERESEKRRTTHHLHMYLYIYERFIDLTC